MGEILKKYANVLDAGDEPNLHNEKAHEASSPSPHRGFVPYADDSGGKKKPGGLYSDKDLTGYSSSVHDSGGKEMEAEVYRQTRAADVDAEKAFEKMAYGGTGEPKRKKSPYAHD